MLEYVLENNHLTIDKPNDRYAHTVNVLTRTQEDLATAISQRNMGISKAEALAMLEASTEIQLEWIKDGNSVNLDLVHIHPAIPGTFEPNEFPHEAVIRVTASKRAAEAAKEISLRHVIATFPIQVSFVYDQTTGTTNDKITRGGVIRITGHNLRVEGDDPYVGLEFINIEDPTNYFQVSLDKFINNNPSELLIFVPPQMSVGKTMQLKITTQYSGRQKLLVTPHVTTFERTLTVV